MKDKTMKEKALYIYGRAGVLLILLLMVILLTFMTDTFLTYRNLINIVRQVTFYAIVGYGAMVTLIGGDFDLSPGSVIGLTSILSTMAITGTERGVGLPLLIAVAVGLAVGFVNGFLIAYCSLPAFIATLGTQTLLRGLALYIANGKPISGLSEKFTNVGGGSIGIVPIPVIILIILGLVTWYIMKYTRLGRHIYAIGGNAQAAVVSGVNAKRVKLFTYLYAGVMAAIAGVILTARVASGNAALGETYEMKAITGCVIGGVSLNGGIGSIYGMTCGILVVGVLTNGMDLMNVSGYMQKVAEGIIMIVAVLLDVVRAKSAK
ncbi:ABC transporter permease [Ruminococcus gauvreauii]|uniref:ABC transporter permease n=1 Tax=Ruminococcus gauvreauii TaxID=438033 RepID=A0ABY5VJU0_9FIRM|nr:ABC transporter permease [Ruminococcus gauvreauii]UWP60647.1 ABC transporter permease [Ruminococcus gauvreauii]